MILVVGATGRLGTAICRSLCERGSSVFGMVRASSSPEAVAGLERMGVTPVVADLADRDSLRQACSGCDAVVSSMTAMGRSGSRDTIERVDRDGQLAVIAAAAEEAIERFVYVSYSGAIGKDDPLTLAKRAVERTLKHSGMSWTAGGRTPRQNKTRRHAEWECSKCACRNFMTRNACRGCGAAWVSTAKVQPAEAAPPAKDQHTAATEIARGSIKSAESALTAATVAGSREPTDQGRCPEPQGRARYPSGLAGTP